jgi:hypothetical protein
MHTSAASTRLGGTDVLTAAGLQMLFGIWLWASVRLALVVAFSLELDDPFWAGTSAAIVRQPQLGASLRKGWFRMIGIARSLRFRRHGAAQLCVPRGGTRRLYAYNHLRRQHRRDGWGEDRAQSVEGRAQRKSSASAEWCGILRRDAKALFGRFAEATAAADAPLKHTAPFQPMGREGATKKLHVPDRTNARRGPPPAPSINSRRGPRFSSGLRCTHQASTRADELS